MKDVAITDQLAYGENCPNPMEILVGHKLVEIKENSVVVEHTGGLKEIEADTVIMAVGFRPQPLLERLKSVEGLEVYSIGDCVMPAKIFDAFHAGYKLGLRI